MSFTGKASYSAGASLPELAEDISDLIGIVSPFETPLLDALGDPLHAARNTYHEWLEDSLLPNRDTVSDNTYVNPSTDTTFDVAHGDRFRPGDQIQLEGSAELMLVTAVAANTLTVTRGYAATVQEPLEDGKTLNILSNTVLEGADKAESRFTNRARRGNYTQIFTASVEVSGSMLAVRQAGLNDELDYQKQERLRELLRDLENTVINGGQAAASPQGSAATRRTLRGIVQHIQTHLWHPGDPDLPAGSDLDEEKLNFALRQIWESSNGQVDTILVNGSQKRRINRFISANRRYQPADQTFRDMIGTYESDFGVCQIVLSRWVPRDAVILLDSSRVSVLPLSGRSFQFKPLAAAGDYECGQIIGEYTLEMRNEEAHGCLRGLSV